MTVIETTRNKLIYYTNNIAGWIYAVEGVILGLSALAADMEYPGLHIVHYWIVAITGFVVLRSGKKHDCIWLALVMCVAALGTSTFVMKVADGGINTGVWVLQLIPILVNSIRYYWLIMGKAERLAVPPRAPRHKQNHKTMISSGYKKAVNHRKNYNSHRNTRKYKRSWNKTNHNVDFGRGTGDPMLDEIMDRYGINEKQARARVRNCQRDLDAAMDDGCMEELEDIVAEQLGDSGYTDYLI